LLIRHTLSPPIRADREKGIVKPSRSDKKHKTRIIWEPNGFLEDNGEDESG
jgi:hypothetical protein